jgi:hypothetical protein
LKAAFGHLRKAKILPGDSHPIELQIQRRTARPPETLNGIIQENKSRETNNQKQKKPSTQLLKANKCTKIKQNITVQKKTVNVILKTKVLAYKSFKIFHLSLNC